MSARAEAILGDAHTLAATALELAIVDHEELETEAQQSHAITACLLAAVEMASECGVESDRIREHIADLLGVALALRNRELN